MQNDPSGETLVRLRAEGATALAEVFMRHRAGLRRMVGRRLDSRLAKRVDASDILQEGFVDAARRLDDYLQEPTMPLVQWLKVVLKRRIIASYRRHFLVQKRDVRKEESFGRATSGPNSREYARPTPARDATPSAIVSQAEQQSRISQAIAALEPLDREIILLRHAEQLTNLETALRLEISPSAASKRYIRALQRLRTSHGASNIDLI